MTRPRAQGARRMMHRRREASRCVHPPQSRGTASAKRVRGSWRTPPGRWNLRFDGARANLRPLGFRLGRADRLRDRAEQSGQVARRTRRRRQQVGIELLGSDKFQAERQLGADDRTGGGADDQRGVAKINSLLDQPGDEARFPSAAHRTTGSEHKRPRALRAALSGPSVQDGLRHAAQIPHRHGRRANGVVSLRQRRFFCARVAGHNTLRWCHTLVTAGNPRL